MTPYELGRLTKLSFLPTFDHTVRPSVTPLKMPKLPAQGAPKPLPTDYFPGGMFRDLGAVTGLMPSTSAASPPPAAPPAAAASQSMARRFAPPAAQQPPPSPAPTPQPVSAPVPGGPSSWYDPSMGRFGLRTAAGGGIASTPVNASLELLDAVGALPESLGGTGLGDLGWSPSQDFRERTSIGEAGNNPFGYAGPGAELMQYGGAAMNAFDYPLRSTWEVLTGLPRAAWDASTGWWQGRQLDRRLAELQKRRAALGR